MAASTNAPVRVQSVHNAAEAAAYLRSITQHKNLPRKPLRTT